jgi:hypothetical protein
MTPSHYYRLATEPATDGPHMQATGEFLLRCLLGARQEATLPSNQAGYDEDVNVYLVGLLERFLSSQYHDEARRYLHARDLDLLEDAQRSPNPRHVFQLYRVNADHLLLAIGLFHHVEGAHHPGNPLVHREPEDFIHRGGVYYHIASSNLRRLRRQVSGPEIAMRKLGDGFADYAAVLRRVRTSFFHLTERLGEGTLFHLSRRPPDPTQVSIGAEDRKGLYDGFLDAFSAWRQQPGPQQLEVLRSATQRLREADPEFRFALPDEAN